MQLIQKLFLKKFFIVSACSMVLSGISLSGCSDSQHRREIEHYIADIKAKPQQTLPSLPPIKEYPVPKYAVAELRSPFQPNTVQADSAHHRPKEPLENFPLDSLHLVGIITRDDQTWGLITAPDNKIYQITIGQYLGQNAGKVVAIHPKHIDIVEMVEDGDQLTKQHVKLILWAHSQAAPNTNN